MVTNKLTSNFAIWFLGSHEPPKTVKHPSRTLGRNASPPAFFLNERGFQPACTKYFDALSVAQWLSQPLQMQPIAAAAAWDGRRV
jgi:hypothetical protein